MRASISLRSTEATAPEEQPAPSQAGKNIAAKMCQSYGSLKTEEKTECQCGQGVRASTFGWS